jgi:RNA polymerase sigma factor for flagellar operon FliA
MSRKITELEQDELASMGVNGLYDAVDGYRGIHPKTGKKVKFETFAAHRIRGSILDAIRDADWVPRLVRSRSNKINETRDSLSASLGRSPNSIEMAEAMDMSIEEYDEYVKSASVQNVMSLHAAGPTDDDYSCAYNGRQSSAIDMLQDEKAEEPISHALRSELKAKLMSKGFTEQEKDIVNALYFESKTMKDIANSMGLSESRVSQKHTSILERLRDKVHRNPNFFREHLLDLLGESR